MSQQHVVTRKKTFKCAGALAQNLRVCFDGSNNLTTAGATGNDIGTLDEASFAAGDYRSIHLYSGQGTMTYVASGSVSKGDLVYPAAGGKLSTVAVGSARGVANEAASDGDNFEVLPVRGLGSVSQLSIVAASTAVTNTTAETAFDEKVTLKANTLRVGDVLRIFAQAIATATNSTDTLTLKLKVGSDTIVATGAVDVANNDIGVIVADFVVRTIGASGTAVGAGLWDLGVPDTATGRAHNLASAALDTTVDNDVTVTATWSVASASNSCRLDILNVSRLSN